MHLLLKKHKTNVIFWLRKNFNSKEITEEVFLQELENKSLNVDSLNKFSKFLAKINNEKSYLFYYKKSLGDTDSTGQTYIWRTENDGKTRPEHAAKEGQTFIWDEDENPGDDYGCRCRAEFLDENGNKTGLGRVKYDEDGNKFTQELKDKDGSVDLMAENTSKILNGRGVETGIKNPSTPGGLCGRYTGLALEAAGFEEFKNRPALARNYGEPLEKAGFEEINSGNASSLSEKYSPRKGDVAVFQDYPGQKDTAGHVQMFDGDRWISDYKQDVTSGAKARNDQGFLPGEKYRNVDFKIYRSEDW